MKEVALVIQGLKKMAQIVFMLKYFFGQDNPNSGKFNENITKRFCLYVPLLISLLVKMVLLFFLYDDAINMDGTLYISAAMEFAAGNFTDGLALYPMPFYPFLIAFTHIFIDDWILSGYVISIASIVLTTIPLFYLTRYMFGMRPAFWACLIFAFLPKMNDWAFYISRDALYLMSVAWCVYFALRSIREIRISLLFMTMILAWISVLLRIEGVTFIVFFFGVLVWLSFTDKRERSAYSSMALIWIGLPLLLITVAFLLFGNNIATVNRFNQVIDEIFKLLNGDFLNLYFQIYQFFSDAESSAPFSGWKCNFAALARHHLLIIYAMGMVEVLMKIIFPLSCIPLYMGLKDKTTLTWKFIIGVWIVHFGIVYYSLLTRDFITTRFLMIPAFLLLPWIGSGIDKLCGKINKSSHKSLLLSLITLIVLSPAIKSYDGVLSSRNATPLAARWLAENDMLKDSLIATNDKKISFYIKLEKEKSWTGKKLYYSDDPKGSDKIEQFALKKNADILIINLYKKKVKTIPDYKFYKRIHTIFGAGDIVQIYSRNDISGA